MSVPPDLAISNPALSRPGRRLAHRVPAFLGQALLDPAARQGGWRRLFTRELRSRVELDCLEAVPAQEVSAEQLRASVLSLRGDRR